MQDSQIKDSIVPIYCDGEFNGTGFIYKSYLITAAHVILGFNRVEYWYNNVMHSVSHDSIVYKNCFKPQDEYGTPIFNFLEEDLAIVKIEEYSDVLVMDESVVDDRMEAKLYGYHYNEFGKITLKNGDVIILNKITLPSGHIVSQDYCISCENMDKNLNIIKGYSGGPVILGNKIVGMLFGVFQEVELLHLMKSTRILKIISEYEKNATNDNAINIVNN